MVALRAAIFRQKGKPLVHRTEPAYMRLVSTWEWVRIFDFTILPIRRQQEQMFALATCSPPASSGYVPHIQGCCLASLLVLSP